MRQYSRCLHLVYKIGTLNTEVLQISFIITKDTVLIHFFKYPILLKYCAGLFLSFCVYINLNR